MQVAQVLQVFYMLVAQLYSIQEVPEQSPIVRISIKHAKHSIVNHSPIDYIYSLEVGIWPQYRSVVMLIGIGAQYHQQGYICNDIKTQYHIGFGLC